MPQKVASDRGVIQMSWSHRTPNKSKSRFSSKNIMHIIGTN